ncbi:MAG: hypothetical protein LiPW39_510 [Parcubacteria group bacterium LiPW_39]|nr:MAG: hypothetical protein LiPW39_510 [Parcubacteria group bacterium LiPW_39]
MASYLSLFGVAGYFLIKNIFSAKQCHPELVSGSNKMLKQVQHDSSGGDYPKFISGSLSFFYFPLIFISLFIAYLVQNFFVFDTLVSYLMLFFVLALIAGSNLSTCEVERLTQNSSPKRGEAPSGLFAQPPLAKGGGKRNPPLFKGGLGGIYLSWHKKLILFLFIFFIIFSLYFLNLKPILASYRANQILSLAPEDYNQVGPLLNKALSSNTFASAEIIYQTTIDYLSKANAAPQLTQNENFYKLAAGELRKNIERSPLQLRNYIALAWLNLYFSDRHQERIESAVALAQKAKELAPVRKDAYLILTAAYSISDEPQKAQEVVKRAEAIDAGLGKEVKQYWENLNKN